MTTNTKTLSREMIVDYFRVIGKALADKGVVAEVAIHGGSALALMFDFRDATHDIDFYPITVCDEELKLAVEGIARADGLGADWFNSAITDIIDESHHTFYGDFPQENPGLRVFVATPQYILAVKALSMRSSLDSNDPFDVWSLMKECGIESSTDLVDLISGFFPRRSLSRRSELIIMDMLEAQKAGVEYDPKIGL